MFAHLVLFKIGLFVVFIGATVACQIDNTESPIMAAAMAAAFMAGGFAMMTLVINSERKRGRHA